MASLIDEVVLHRNHIKHEAITFSISELVNMYRSEPKEIEIRPNFQRLFRWSREQQCSFIESLLLEMPIPPLFFFEKEDGSWDLLDGLQRLSTIIKFIGTGKDTPPECQGIDHNESDWHYDNENNIAEPLQLVSGEYLTGLCGLTFVRLPSQLQLNLKRARLHVYVLKRETKPMYKYEVFKRLNRGGAWLEDQELRNCSVRMLDETFPEFIQHIAKTDSFLSALSLPQEKINNGYIEELCLRYFTMKNYADNFKHDVSAFLTKYMEEVAGKKVAFDYGAEEKLFHLVWGKINSAMPDGDAFKGKAVDDLKTFGPFSPSLFEMVSVGIANNIAIINPVEDKILKESIGKLIVEAKASGLTGSGSNSRAKTLGRLQYATGWFLRNHKQ